MKRNHRHLASWTDAGLTALMSGLVVIALYGPRGGPWLTRPAEDFAALMRADPKLGTRVDLPQRDLYEHVIAPIETLIVHGGDCTTCSLHAFQPQRLRLGTFRQVLLVYSSRASDIPASYRRLPPEFRVIADQNARFLKTLNAAWHPRAYVLAGDGRLIGCSPGPGVWPAGVSDGP